jgi:O-antigen/teichoic acid export membrane protein
MKRIFLTNVTLLVFLNLLVKPFWIFGIDLTVQNTVGANEYGFYFSLLSFSLLLNIIQDLGISNYNSRNIARNPSLLPKLLPNILILKFLLTLIYFTISFALAIFIGYQWLQLKLLIILLFNQFLNSLNLYLRSNIAGLQLFRTDSLLSITDRLLMIIFCSLLLWGNILSSDFSIEWFVYAQTTAYFITTLITLSVVLNNTRLNWLKLDFSITKDILIKSYPYAILGLLMVLYYRTDSVMLERMLPDGKLQAGIYAQAFRILDAASMLGFLFAGILLPMFSRMLKQNESIIQLFRFSSLLLLVPAITAAIALGFYRMEFMDLLYKDYAEESGNIFGILMLCFVFISISIISGTLLTARGNLRELNRIAVFSVMMNIILNLILIPGHQAIGSAIASLVTQFFAALFQMLAVMIIFRIKPGAALIIQLFMLVTVLLITGYIVSALNLNWVQGLFIILITGPVTSLIIRLLTIRDIKSALI